MYFEVFLPSRSPTSNPYPQYPNHPFPQQTSPNNTGYNPTTTTTTTASAASASRKLLIQIEILFQQTNI